MNELKTTDQKYAEKVANDYLDRMATIAAGLYAAGGLGADTEQVVRKAYDTVALMTHGLRIGEGDDENEAE